VQRFKEDIRNEITFWEYNIGEAPISIDILNGTIDPCEEFRYTVIVETYDPALPSDFLTFNEDTVLLELYTELAARIGKH